MQNCLNFSEIWGRNIKSDLRNGWFLCFFGRSVSQLSSFPLIWAWDDSCESLFVHETALLEISRYNLFRNLRLYPIMKMIHHFLLLLKYQTSPQNHYLQIYQITIIYSNKYYDYLKHNLQKLCVLGIFFYMNGPEVHICVLIYLHISTVLQNKNIMIIIILN